MTVAEAIQLIPEHGTGLGTLLGLDGEVVFLPDENDTIETFVTKKGADGKQVETEGYIVDI
ncbi:MAG: hypothetical protein KAJ40_01375 [Alphaproteobacteria bacterium]|nr:hypothetical protein [Alphaproteobacteria bacterium]